MTNTYYQRGTKTHKATSASLQPGAVLLTAEGPPVRVKVAASKTGAILRTVERTERQAPEPINGFTYGRQVRIVVYFTDGTFSVQVAPSQTWMAVEN